MLGHANGIDESLQQSDRTKNDVLKHRNYIQRLMKHPGEREREREGENPYFRSENVMLNPQIWICVQKPDD